MTYSCSRGWGKKKDHGAAVETGASSTMKSDVPLKTPAAGSQPQSQDPVQPVSNTVDMEKTARIKGQVAEVSEIMSQNIEAAKQRGENLENLQDKVQDLELGAKQFGENSKKVKQNLWYKNKKMTVILTLVALIVLAVIAAVIYFSVKK